MFQIRNDPNQEINLGRERLGRPKPPVWREPTPASLPGRITLITRAITELVDYVDRVPKISNLNSLQLLFVRLGYNDDLVRSSPNTREFNSLLESYLIYVKSIDAKSLVEKSQQLIQHLSELEICAKKRFRELKVAEKQNL